jgi:hypothetical protein
MSELFLQLLVGNRRRTAEPEDGLGKWADNRIHGGVLPIQRPTIGKEVRSDDRSMIHDHRGSMPPKDLGTARDVIGSSEQTAGSNLILGTQCT